jgi:hypothetical protein
MRLALAGIRLRDVVLTRLLSSNAATILTPDSLDSHIPQGYQGVRPM